MYKDYSLFYLDGDLTLSMFYDDVFKIQIRDSKWKKKKNSDKEKKM